MRPSGIEMVRGAHPDAGEHALRHQRLARFFDAAWPVALAGFQIHGAARETLVHAAQSLER